jgi:hypothetical protein
VENLLLLCWVWVFWEAEKIQFFQQQQRLILKVNSILTTCILKRNDNEILRLQINPVCHHNEQGCLKDKT